MREIGLREIFLSSGSPGLKTIKLCDYVLGSLAARMIPAQVQSKVPTSISRILVIRPGGIGDAVFLLPVFKAVKSKHPQVSIDVLCQGRNAQVFLAQEHLADHVYVYDSFTDLKSVCRNNYDIVIDTEQWHYLTALTAINIKARTRIGFCTRDLRRKFFNVNVDYSLDAYELDNFLHLFECLLEAQEPIRNIEDCFHLPQSLVSWGKLQIPSNSVTISIGASVPERCLSVEQGIILAKGLLRRGFHPVFLGGKDCLLPSAHVLAQLDSAEVYNFAGKISLQESAALIKTSGMFIGTDSGLMHLASAVGSRVIALFGAGNMKKWMRQKEGQVSVSEHVPCSPCTVFGYGLPVCRGSFRCLRTMDLELILEQHLQAEIKNG